MLRFQNASKLLAAAVNVVLASALLQPVMGQNAPEFNDLHGYSMETPAIKNMVAQGIMSTTAPGTFEPGTAITRSDFAVALQRLFSLPQPSHPVKFSDVHPTDSFYAAVEAVAPYIDKQVPCPGCDLGSTFYPAKPVSRAQWAITVVRILIERQKLQLLNEEQSDKILASVPDSKDVPKRARTYFATALDGGVLECCAGNYLAVDQIPSRADVAEMLNNIQTKFGFALVKQGA